MFRRRRFSSFLNVDEVNRFHGLLRRSFKLDWIALRINITEHRWGCWFQQACPSEACGWKLGKVPGRGCSGLRQLPEMGDKHGQVTLLCSPQETVLAEPVPRSRWLPWGQIPGDPPGSLVPEPVVVFWFRWRPEVLQSLLLLLSSECKLQPARVMPLMLIPRDSASHMLFPFSLASTMV